jgi:hypothetical protein
VPAINDAGAVAFLGKWSTVEGIGAGIFVDDTLVVKAGDSPPSLGNATFASFKDPVIDAAGHVAFLATVAGPGVTPLNDSVLATDAFGSLEVIAHEGAVVAEPGTPRLRKIISVSLVDGELLFTAKLKGGFPPVTNFNDDVAFRVTSTAGMTHVVREGDPFSSKRVKSFRLLQPVPGSPAQNRGHAAGNSTFLALLSGGEQALLSSTGGTLNPLAMQGDRVSDVTLPQAEFKSFGVVAADGSRLAFRAKLYAGLGGVTKANGEAIFEGDGENFELVARVGFPGVGSTIFRTLGDPVLARGADSVAFPAMLSGESSATDATLWWKPVNSPLTLLAREGGSPPDLPIKARWQTFLSLALPGGGTGPIFVATLERGAGGVAASNDVGVWAINSLGTLRLLFREGDTIENKVLKNFTVLTAVAGSPGVTRSFNNHGQLVWRANFTDGTSALMVSQVP